MPIIDLLKALLLKIRAIFSSRREYKFLKNEFRLFERASEAGGRFQIKWADRYLCVGDKTNDTHYDRHYVYHPAWAARIIAETRPECHVDISSSLSFCTIVSAFVPVQFFDYRPADIRLDGLHCGAADLVRLPFADATVSSLSCMHVVEHVGLGRYGDPLDPDGDLKAIAELTRVLAKGGSLLFVVPIGRKARIIFNAHRIYTYGQIVGYFESLDLVEFALIPDNASDGGLLRFASPELAMAQTYGCGCFWFIRSSETVQ